MLQPRGIHIDVKPAPSFGDERKRLGISHNWHGDKVPGPSV
jgi:hypothetical protein